MVEDGEWACRIFWLLRDGLCKLQLPSGIYGHQHLLTCFLGALRLRRQKCTSMLQAQMDSVAAPTLQGVRQSWKMLSQNQQQANREKLPCLSM